MKYSRPVSTRPPRVRILSSMSPLFSITSWNLKVKFVVQGFPGNFAQLNHFNLANFVGAGLTHLYIFVSFVTEALESLVLWLCILNFSRIQVDLTWKPISEANWGI
jgi:hypothetical protein